MIDNVLNVLTSREDQFKSVLESDFSLVFNGDLDEHEFNLIDYEHCSEQDDDFIITNCVYFSSKVGLLDKKSFGSIKPDFFLCCNFEDLNSHVKRFINFASGDSILNAKQVISKNLTSTADLKALHEVAMKDISFNADHVRDRFLLILDELSSNTLYNAPVDDNGIPLFRRTDRSEDVVLEDKESINVTISENDDELHICCSDTYGSLFADTVKNYLFREIVAPQQREGGAGIGLSLIFENCNSLLYNIELNERTEVTAVIKKFKKNKDHLLASKEVFLTEKGSF